MNDKPEKTSRNRSALRARREQRNRVLAALPALICGAAGILLTIVIAARPLDAQRQSLERRADQAVATRDYATARIWYKRLLQDEPDNSHLQDGLALTMQMLRQKSPSAR